MRSAMDLLDRRIKDQLDARRCQVVDEVGCHCNREAYQLGYCAQHWGR